MKYTTSGDCQSPKSPCAVSSVTLSPRKRVKGHFVFPPLPEAMDSSNPSTTSSYIQILEANRLHDNTMRADLISTGSSGIGSCGSGPTISHSNFTEDNIPQTKSYVSKCSFYAIVLVISLVYICTAALAFCFIFSLISKCNDLEVKLNSAHVSQVAYQQDPHMCVPCDALAQGPFEEENEQLAELPQRTENGTLVCCARTSAQISILLNLFARRKQLAKCAQELLMENSTGSCNTTTSEIPESQPVGTISAHLQVGLQKKRDQEDTAIRYWKYDQPGTHLQGITMSADKLVVPETGLYFVYSQVGFLVFYDNEINVAKAKQSIFHNVMRYNPIYPKGSQKLLSSEVTQCWENKEYGRYKSYIGASLQLNKGDQIYVTTSRISLLSREPSLSYFGMYRVR